MKTNISPLNRGARSIIGALIILISVFLFAKTSFILIGIGVVLVLTGAIGFCPIDHYLHMKQQP